MACLFTVLKSSNLVRISVRRFGIISSIKRQIFPTKPNIAEYIHKGKGLVVDHKKSNPIEIQKDIAIKYDADREIIIKNYGSAITSYESFNDMDRIPVVSKTNPIHKQWRQNVLGKIYSGTVDCIPPKLTPQFGHPVGQFKVGDRVCGINTGCFSYGFCEYTPVYVDSMCFAPTNIPLHFAALFVHGYYFIDSLISNPGEWNLHNAIDKERLENMSVVIIGTGNLCFLTTVLYYLQFAKVKHIDIVCTSQQQYDRFRPAIEEFQCKFNTEIRVTCGDSMDAKQRYDLIIHTSSNNTDDIVNDIATYANDSGYIWLMNTVFADLFWENAGNIKATKAWVKWSQSIAQNKEVVRNKNVTVSTGMLHDTEKSLIGLNRFNRYLSNKIKEPQIIIDKIYGLDDAISGLKYHASQNRQLIGDNLSVVIEKEDIDTEFNVIMLPDLGN
eukprot:26392_1